MLTDLPAAESRGRRQQLARNCTAETLGQVLPHVYFHTAREKPRGEPGTRKSILHEDAHMSTKSHLVTQGLHHTLSPIPWHDTSDRDETRATCRTAITGLWHDGPESTALPPPYVMQKQQWRSGKHPVREYHCKRAPVSKRAGVRLHVMERFILEMCYILLLKQKNKAKPVH